MVCFFCGSEVHLSRKCHIYVTDSIRKELIFSKMAVSIFVLPKIDRVLVSRFYQMLSKVEQCHLVLSSTEVYHLIKPEIFQVKLMDTLYYNDLIKCSNLIAAGVSEIQLHRADSISADAERFYHSSLLRNMSTKAKEISLSGKMLTSDLFFILSSKTKSLKCNRLILTPSITFKKLLRKIPNISDLEICKTNIVISKTWPSDLLKIKHIKKLKQLTLTVTMLDFDVEALIELIQKKRIKNYSAIFLIFNGSNSFEETRDILKQHFSELFIPTDEWINLRTYTPKISVYINVKDGKYAEKRYFDSFKLKKSKCLK